MSRDIVKAIDFAGHIGRKLRLPKEAVNVAQVLIHSFFDSNSTKEFDAPLISLSALYLASKVVECPCRLRDAISVAYCHLHPEQPLLEVNGDLYWELRDSIVTCEMLILRCVNYNVDIVLSHKYLYIYAMALCTAMADGKKWARQTTQLAYMIINDSFRSADVVAKAPNVIAASALYLSLRLLDKSVAIQGESQWWETMGCSTDELLTTVDGMMAACQRTADDNER
ncbi:hypothetical protein SARC_09120 [Sphaeroforma arctica JP610]|uniref:Cyclin-like domain-containing protein n=1 Tax=Sphaeroforma arctica JP610 TaxID=667725 RepID=A0A0L0FNN7_9EUKA|nr:hypothetical protein SARC_09120 [Sphaeroforma arctica JP610]KNC78445.1 hypothetical protein SARC_09120 [Sphaeroforma arctica JP610]|eukprot:XP_014152347.1 hypothetical protein SARC_09120 [Sphaeroforma arctica JP610]